MGKVIAFPFHLVRESPSPILGHKATLIVLVPRETPLTAINLENMLKLARLGVVILPPVPGFYTKPKSIDELIDHTVGKCLDQFDIEHDLYKRWGT